MQNGQTSDVISKFDNQTEILDTDYSNHDNITHFDVVIREEWFI